MFAPGCCITDIMETPRARNAIIPDEGGGVGGWGQGDTADKKSVDNEN